MKTEPTEALNEIKHCTWVAEDFNIGDGFESHEVVDEDDVINIANIAFSEGQSSPKIKRLEWENHGSSITAVGISDYEYCINLKDYHVTLSLRSNSQIIVLGQYSRPGEAKAVAQADFEKRVMGCLDL